MNRKTFFLIIFLLLVGAFFAGSKAARIKYGKGQGGPGGQGTTPSLVPEPTLPPFTPRKSARPEIKFFVMSFCPYGNQAEAGLEPVYRLLKDKVDWQPKYIVDDKKASCEQSCPYRVYDEARCQQLVETKKVPDIETCKTYFPYKTAAECLEKECASLKPGEYSSLHGPQELNQDVREICALKEAVGVGSGVLGAKLEEGILDKWWKFVSLVNDKCSANDADTCWKEQAKTAGFEMAKISSCSQSQVKNLLNAEITETQKYQVSGSPTVIINDSIYNGGRSPEDYKKAICSAFENPPEECNQSLGQESATTSGGCGTP